MKYFILLLLFPISLLGQNWQPLNFQDKYNFRIDTNEYITNTLWIDSTEIAGTDTIYFLNKIAATCNHCDTIEADPETLFLQLQGQFLGTTITKEPSGRFLFSGNEDFVLYPQAPLDFSWSFQINGTDSLMARIAAVGETEIFGITDSVKCIVFEELDTMVLSKNYGILSFPTSDGPYELMGIEGRDLGEILPGVKEMYDFQVGDVFQHYTENFGFGRSETIRKVRILGREDQDSSIVYFTNVIVNRVSFETQTTSPPVYSYFNNDIEQIIDLNGDVSTSFLNETYPHQLHSVGVELFDYFCYDPAPDDLYLSFKVEKDIETGRIIKSTDLPATSGGQGIYTFVNDTSDLLKTQNCLGYTLYRHETGLGEVYRYSEILDNVVTSYLMGYVKDGDTTGVITPDIVLSVKDELADDRSISINPTLSTGIFKLKTANGFSLQLMIYNSQGQLIRQRTNQPSGQDIDLDLSNEPSGIYFVKIWLDQQFQNIKIVKIE